MPVLTIELFLTEGEADRMVCLLAADATANAGGLAAYVEEKVSAARADEAAREARSDDKLRARLAAIRAKAEATCS